MGLLLLGAFVAAFNDLTFNPIGYVWMMTNVISNVSHLLVLRKLKLNKDLSNTQVLLPPHRCMFGFEADTIRASELERMQLRKGRGWVPGIRKLTRGGCACRFCTTQRYGRCSG